MKITLDLGVTEVTDLAEMITLHRNSLAFQLQMLRITEAEAAVNRRLITVADLVLGQLARA